MWPWVNLGEKQKMSDDYKSGGAYKAMLKIFRKAKLEKEKEKEKYKSKPEHQCMRCKDLREVWVWKDTCLLYTSPSPRDRQKYRMPSSA